MATLAHLVANSLWFAFDALDQRKTGHVPKSQLKVLTQNVGVLLGVGRRVEEGVADYHSASSLTFDQFLYFLTHEVLSDVDDGATPYDQLKVHHDALDDAFWQLCRGALLPRHYPVFSPQAVFRLWRVFCLLADRVPAKKALLQVALPVVEVREATRKLVVALGREWDECDFNQLAQVISCFTFPVFLTFLEGRYVQDQEPAGVDRAVHEVYSYFVEQVLKQGKLYQRVRWAPLWLRRDVEVRPWGLVAAGVGGVALGQALASTRFRLTPEATVHNLPDEPGAKPSRFTLCLTSNKLVHLAAPDYKSKSEWLRALDVAIHHSRDAVPYHLSLSAARKLEYQEEEARETAERIRRDSQADIIENTQAELMAEKLAREEAEAQAREELAARQTEEKRVLELQTLRLQLETLLEEETQAKRDEEIVRNLQARVLREEWERREELENLQAEQRRQLLEETKKRQEFEREQEKKDRQLREAEERLRQLENERMRLDRDLRAAREKITSSERGKELLEVRMKVKERTPPVRTWSLRPVRRERGNVPKRSSSFNAHAARLFKFRSKPESEAAGDQGNGATESSSEHGNGSLDN